MKSGRDDQSERPRSSSERGRRCGALPHDELGRENGTSSSAASGCRPALHCLDEPLCGEAPFSSWGWATVVSGGMRGRRPGCRRSRPARARPGPRGRARQPPGARRVRARRSSRASRSAASGSGAARARRCGRALVHSAGRCGRRARPRRRQALPVARETLRAEVERESSFGIERGHEGEHRDVFVPELAQMLCGRSRPSAIVDPDEGRGGVARLVDRDGGQMPRERRLDAGIVRAAE